MMKLEIEEQSEALLDFAWWLAAVWCVVMAANSVIEYRAELVAVEKQCGTTRGYVREDGSIQCWRKALK